MKTLDEIVNNYEEWSVFLDDRFGVRLAQFLTQEQLEKIGFKWNSDEPYPVNILESKIILYEKERKAIIRHLKEGNIELLKSYFGIEKMKEYYLIKCRNNIPFIIGQYDTEEDARKAKNRENPNSELMIVVNIEKDKPEKTS